MPPYVLNKRFLEFIYVLIFCFAFFLIFLNTTLANTWASPKEPVINGNNYIFITIGDINYANQPAIITISDPNATVKQTCNVTRNKYGYSRCKYTFSPSDVAGTWTYTATSETGGNVSVGKISLSVSSLDNLSSVKYGQKNNIGFSISTQSPMEKEIFMQDFSRDLGTHAVRHNFLDVDGNGDKEIVINEYGGYLFIWDSLERLKKGISLIAGTDWRMADAGTNYYSSKCAFGDFDGDGKMTMFCPNSDTSSHIKAFKNINLGDGTNVSATFTTTGLGTFRGEPTLCDVTGDGVLDQVGMSSNEGIFYVFDYSDTAGFTLNYTSPDWGSNVQDSVALCADFDGDDKNEWIAYEYNTGARYLDVDHTTKAITLGNALTDRGSYFAPTAFDIDEDGADEAIFPISTGHMQVIGYSTTTGQIFEDMTWQSEGADITDFSYGTAVIKIDDLDKDGQPDFAITGVYNQPYLLFYKYNSSNDTLSRSIIYEAGIKEQTKSVINYVDFDGDGIKEIMTFGQLSGNTYVFRFNGESWDLIYKGWKDQEDVYYSGDGKVFAANNDSGWYYSECATGDMDNDGRDETLCTPGDGNIFLYEQPTSTEYPEQNVTPEINLNITLNDGQYQSPSSKYTDIRVLSNGTNIWSKSNIALGVTDISDEDGDNQGNIASLWTDGNTSSSYYKVLQNSSDYATLDASTAEEATWSRIKLPQSYNVGKVKFWNYYNDGRSFDNVIIKTTNDATGALCNWSSPTTIFDNSADGSHQPYSDSPQGKSIYFSPQSIACLRESTSGSDYYTTQNNSSNYRTEIEIYESETSGSLWAIPNKKNDSSLAIKNNWTITANIQDKSGKLINATSTLSLPITWDKLPFNTVIVGGTEYVPGDSGQIVIQLKDEFNDPVSGATCLVDYYYPNKSSWLADQSASELGSTGVYYNDFSAPATEGVYVAIAECTKSGFSDTDSHTFHISNSIAENVWNNGTRTLTDYATSSIATAVWNNTERSLTTFGSLVNDIWSATVRKLTSRQIGDGDYISGVATSTAVSQVANASDLEATKYNAELIRQATFDFAGFADSGTTLTLVDAELTQPDNYWNDYRLQMTSGNNAGETKTVADFDSTTDTITLSSAFSNPVISGDKYVLLHEDRLVFKIWNYSTRTVTSLASAAGDIWSYSGGRTLTALGSIASDVWNDTFSPSRTLTSNVLTSGISLATNTYIDNATSTLISRMADTASSSAQMARWTVEMSDSENILAGEQYRVKIFVLNYLDKQTDPYSTPTVTLYDSERNLIVQNVSMTKLQDGVYEYVYNIPSGATQGVWETIINTEVESSKTLINNDYWEVSGSPAQVIIQNMANTQVPNISAITRITNEGNSGYEYQYEWCVVSSENNTCGGGDDVYYASAAKYINSGDNFDTTLSATVPNPGNYWFKVVVYFGSESSGSSRTFTATGITATPPPTGGGGGGGGASIIESPKPILGSCVGADLNRDGKVNSIDFSILLSFWKTSPPFKNSCVDINQDKNVNAADFSILLFQWGKSPIPYKKL